MTQSLPDCMMPDGAEPCKGYQELQAEIEWLQAHKRGQAEDIMTLGQQVGKLEAEIERLIAALSEIALNHSRQLFEKIDEIERLVAEHRRVKKIWDDRDITQVALIEQVLSLLQDRVHKCEDKIALCWSSRSQMKAKVRLSEASEILGEVRKIITSTNRVQKLDTASQYMTQEEIDSAPGRIGPVQEGTTISWRRVNDNGFEYAIQQGPHGDEFVKLLDGTCLRRPISPVQKADQND